MIEYRINVLQKLKDSGYNTNRLRKERLLGESTIQQLRQNTLVSWHNIDRLCEILNVQPGDLVHWIPNPEPDGGSDNG